MKKHRFAIIITILLCILLSSCSMQKKSLRKTDADKMLDYYIIEEESFFRDFSCNNDEVILTCRVCIQNTSNKTIDVCILGDFQEDMMGGLLKDKFLLAENTLNKSYAFSLAPGKNIFDLEFFGKFGGTPVKQDRLLPKLMIVQDYRGLFKS